MGRAKTFNYISRSLKKTHSESLKRAKENRDRIYLAFDHFLCSLRGSKVNYIRTYNYSFPNDGELPIKKSLLYYSIYIHVWLQLHPRVCTGSVLGLQNLGLDNTTVMQNYSSAYSSRRVFHALLNELLFVGRQFSNQLVFAAAAHSLFLSPVSCL